MTTEVLGPTANTAPAAWIPDDSTFGARLALIRQRMAWGNVKEAATACGLPAESWRTWERDGVEPRGLLRVAKQIADRTGCDLGWLVGGQAFRGNSTRGPAIAPYLPMAERPTAIPHRPPNNRPTGHPSGSRPPTVRRTSRLPRPSHRTGD